MALGLSGEFYNYTNIRCSATFRTASRTEAVAYAKSCELQQLNRRLTQCLYFLPKLISVYLSNTIERAITSPISQTLVNQFN